MARRRRSTTTNRPLVLETFGYLFVGGRIDHSIEGSPMVGQMYVGIFHSADADVTPTRS